MMKLRHFLILVAAILAGCLEGPVGPQGEKGEKGDKGSTGATGATGSKGVDGDDAPQASVLSGTLTLATRGILDTWTFYPFVEAPTIVSVYVRANSNASWMTPAFIVGSGGAVQIWNHAESDIIDATTDITGWQYRIVYLVI